ncbi:MAG: pyridoxamine 5'-phosphate oxidase family protein [Hyphomicrobiaceae bacterium]
MVLTGDMRRIVEEQRLGFVATVDAGGAPHVSPKGTFVVVDDQTLVFGDIRSPGTVRNLENDSRIEINFVDPFVRKGYRFTGVAHVVKRGEPTFADLVGYLRGGREDRFRGVVVVRVERALPLISPGYDAGVAEREMRRDWTTRYRKLQPGGEFDE